MKTVTYMGQTFSVPDEANYIAADDDLEVYTFSEKPTLKRGTWWSSADDEYVTRVGRLPETDMPCEAC